MGRENAQPSTGPEVSLVCSSRHQHHCSQVSLDLGIALVPDYPPSLKVECLSAPPGEKKVSPICNPTHTI